MSHIPTDIWIYISKFMYIDESIKLLHSIKVLYETSISFRIKLKKQLASGDRLNSFCINNREVLAEHIELYTNQYILDSANEYYTSLMHVFLIPGESHSYSFSGYKSRPKIWIEYKKPIIVYADFECNRPIIKHPGWDCVDAVYRSKLGRVFKIKYRPNVAALVY